MHALVFACGSSIYRKRAAKQIAWQCFASFRGGITAASLPHLSSQASDLTLRDCDISSWSGALLPENTPRAPGII